MSRSPRSAESGTPEPAAASFETAWRHRFGEFAAAREDDAGIAGWTPSGLDARIRKFLSLWHGGCPGQLWLDAGCGAGTYTRLLAEHGLQVVGVDYSCATVVKASTRGSGDAMYAVADLHQPPFGPMAFQGILCFGVTQALFRSDALVNELAKLVAPGGELWIDGLNRHCLLHAVERARRFFARRPMHLRYEASAEIVRRMRDAGFVDVKRYWMPIAPPQMPRLQRFFEHPSTCRLLHTLPLLGATVSHSFIVHGRRPL